MHSNHSLVRGIWLGLAVGGALLAGTRLTAQVEEAWAATYHSGGSDEPAEMAVDASGNVYVTGPSSPSGCDVLCEDYATVKYGPDGSLLWVARKNGSSTGGEFSWDRATSLALDGEGNVYVTGWLDMEVGGRNAVTVKYDAQGKEVWTASFDKGANDGGWKVLVHPSGHIYVALRAHDSAEGGDYDTALIKYNPDGTEAWVAQYDGPGNGNDLLGSMALGHSGNIHVAGVSQGAGGVVDCATVTYATDGRVLWVAREPGLFRDGNLLPLAVDSGGNVIVAAPVGAPEALKDIFIVKYDADGRRLWTVTYDGPGGLDDSVNDIAADPAGNIFVVGSSWQGPPDDSGLTTRMLILKYEPSGSLLWRRYLEGSERGWHYASDVIVGSDGCAYVGGAAFNGAKDAGGTGRDLTTIKLDPNGNKMWTKQYNGKGNSDDRFSDLTLDGSENVYIAGAVWMGSIFEGENGMDFATIKYVQVEIPAVPFLRGDADGSGQVKVEDVVFTLAYLFQLGPEGSCRDALDADDSGHVSITDPIYTLNWLFRSGMPPPEPGPAACAADPTVDGLGCEAFQTCPL